MQLPLINVFFQALQPIEVNFLYIELEIAKIVLLKVNRNFKTRTRVHANCNGVFVPNHTQNSFKVGPTVLK